MCCSRALDFGAACRILGFFKQGQSGGQILELRMQIEMQIWLCNGLNGVRVQSLELIACSFIAAVQTFGMPKRTPARHQVLNAPSLSPSCGVAQAAPLKLLEKGVSKEALAGLVLLEFPCELVSAVLAGRWAASSSPFKPWLQGYWLRLLFSILTTTLVRLLWPSNPCNFQKLGSAQTPS